MATNNHGAFIHQLATIDRVVAQVATELGIPPGSPEYERLSMKASVLSFAFPEQDHLLDSLRRWARMFPKHESD